MARRRFRHAVAPTAANLVLEGHGHVLLVLAVVVFCNGDADTAAAAAGVDDGGGCGGGGGWIRKPGLPIKVLDESCGCWPKNCSGGSNGKAACNGSIAASHKTDNHVQVARIVQQMPKH